MSTAVIWAAFGLLALNVAAIVTWAVVCRPKLVVSTEVPRSAMALKPAASAVRSRVPALPGSRRSTTARMGPGGSSSRSGTGVRTTAHTGWGATVSSTRARTPDRTQWASSIAAAPSGIAGCSWST